MRQKNVQNVDEASPKPAWRGVQGGTYLLTVNPDKNKVSSVPEIGRGALPRAIALPTSEEESEPC